jgi:hypothetical protein
MKNQLQVQPIELPALNPDRKAIDTVKLTTAQWLEEKLTTSFDFAGYVIVGKQSLKELREAREELLKQWKRPSDEKIIKALIKLKALTISRNESQEELDVVIEAFTERLREYPEDSVMKVLNESANYLKFFPSWSEIQSELDYYTQHRRSALKAIERKIEDGKRAQVWGDSKSPAQLVRESANKVDL